MRRLLLILLLALGTVGCAVNPVTGESELALMSEQQEIALGEQNYVPSRQMQGGDYTVDPELTQYVSDVGQRLAEVSDRQLPYEFVVINNSVPNAWALSGGKIAVNRGLLLELESEAELAAVLGHEIVHAAARHGAKAQERAMLLQGAVMAAGVAAGDNDFAGVAVGSAAVAAQLIGQKYGRDAELEADYYGMMYMARAGYDPSAAIELQETFVRLSQSRDQSWLDGLFSSHPPSQERIEANRKTAAELEPSGEMNKAPYLARIERLTETREAYEWADEGRRALADENHEQAMALAERSLHVEPREATFHALKGDAYFSREQFYDAVASYNQAIGLDDSFFYLYLQRGLVSQKLERDDQATQDLEASVRLLPTAIAYNSLGDLSRKHGDADTAMAYYRKAAESGAPSGKQAARSLVELDLPRSPARYLPVRLGTDRDGYVLAEVRNPTHVPVKDVQILVEYEAWRSLPPRTVASYGGPQQVRRRIGYVPAGEAATVDLGLPPVPDQSWLEAFQVRIESANIVQ